MKQSKNDKLILSVYESSGLTEETRSGFSTVKQKQGIAGLKLLIPAQLTSGEVLPAGTTVYFDEEYLLSPSSPARNVKKIDFLDKLCIIIDFKQAVAVSIEE